MLWFRFRIKRHSELKDIFYLYTCYEIKSKSLSSSLTKILVAFTTKNGMSSAKRLTVEVIFSDKSLIYTKKNRGPKMDPFGTTI